MSTNTITIKDLEKMSYDKIMEVLKNHHDDIEQEYYCFDDGHNILVTSGYGGMAFTSVLCKWNEVDRVVAQLRAQGYEVDASKVRFC